MSGVTGQDGSYMVDYLLENTSATIIGGARRLSNKNHVNISHLENNPRFKLINFDLTDPHSITKLVEILNPNYFINFAAHIYVGSSWDFPVQTWECNTTGVIHILEAIKQYAPRCRFYNAGSSEEWGNVEYTPQDENHPAKPRSPYGASKVAARNIVKVYRESYNLYAIQGHLTNHESERRGEEFVTRKISKGVARIKHAIDTNQPFEPISLGNVYAKRDWSHSYDFVDGIWRMLNQEIYREELQPELYNEIKYDPCIINSLSETRDTVKVENYELTIQFTLPVNRVEEWQNIGALTGVVSHRTQLELLTDVHDPEQELERLQDRRAADSGRT